jgi:hypothetical protein
MTIEPETETTTAAKSTEEASMSSWCRVPRTIGQGPMALYRPPHVRHLQRSCAGWPRSGCGTHHREIVGRYVMGGLINASAGTLECQFGTAKFLLSSHRPELCQLDKAIDRSSHHLQLT